MAAVNMALVRMYGNLVLNGRRDMNGIPEAYKAAVQKYIDEQTV